MQTKSPLSQLVEAESNAEDLTVLLKWVTEGHLEEVEKLLKKKPILGLGAGAVTDRSERTFSNITALQYAAWALDAEMVELIMEYVGVYDSAVQLNALETVPERYSEYGANYDFKGLVNKYQAYIDNYNCWSDNKCAQYWQKEIGGEQRKCPAWLIYAWSEEGKDVAWTKQDANRKIKREYDKHRLDWWFTGDYNNGRGAGSTWAVFRGGLSALEGLDQRSCMTWKVILSSLLWDRERVLSLGTTHHETLRRLKDEVERSLTGNAPVLCIMQ